MKPLDQKPFLPKDAGAEKIQFKVEIATMKHLKDIQRLNKTLFDEEFKQYDQTIDCDWPLSKDGEKFYRERITNNNGCAFILTNGSEAVGYLVGSLSEDEFYRNVDGFAELDDMFVLEKFRNSGYGSKLYEAFIDWCKERKVKRLKVLVTAKNVQALNFYKQNGFLEHNITLEADLDKLKK